MRFRKILFLAFGHVASDFYPGMLAPLLPLVTETVRLVARAGRCAHYDHADICQCRDR